MLVDKETGEEREVDVTLTTELAGHKVVLSIEATERKRPADAKWVEAEIAKHRSLPTNKLILVADAGFTKPAKAKVAAQQGKVVALTPEEIKADPKRVIVSRLGVVLAKTVKIMSPKKLVVAARAANEEIVVSEVEEGYDVPIFDSDGNQTSTVRDESRRRINAVANELPDELEISDQPHTRDARCQMTVHGWSYRAEQLDGSTTQGTYRIEVRLANGEIERAPIEEVHVDTQIQIEVTTISLSHMRLGAATASFGEASLVDGDGLLVVTEDDHGSIRASLRASDGQIADLALDESLTSPSSN